jgi:hypothetical protein
VHASTLVTWWGSKISAQQCNICESKENVGLQSNTCRTGLNDLWRVTIKTKTDKKQEKKKILNFATWNKWNTTNIFSLYDLMLFQWLSIIKFSWATSWAKWLKGEKKKKKKKKQCFEDHLCPRPQGTDMTGDPVCHTYTCLSKVFMVAH